VPRGFVRWVLFECPSFVSRSALVELFRNYVIISKRFEIKHSTTTATDLSENNRKQ
jgi:hypothetical protein